MKFSVLVLLAVTGFQSSALAADSSGQVALSAGKASQTIQLVDQKYDPVYTEVPYQTTCTRQVFDHNETECSTTYDSVCHDGPQECDTVSDSVCHGGGQVCETTNDSVCNSSGCTTVPRRECHDESPVCTDVPRRECHDGSPVCTDVPRQSCSQEPVYRNEDYTCTQYEEEQTGETLVKTYNHNVTVTVANPEILAASGLKINVSATENQVTAVLSNAYTSALLTYAMKVTATSDTGDVLTQSENIVIDVAATAEALKAFQSGSMTGLTLGKNEFRFNIPGAASLQNNLNLSVNLVRTPTLWFKSTKVDKTIASSQLGLVTQGSDLKAIVPWAKLGEKALKKVKYSLTVTASLNLGTLLNPADFNGFLNKQVSQSITKSDPTF